MRLAFISRDIRRKPRNARKSWIFCNQSATVRKKNGFTASPMSKEMDVSNQFLQAYDEFADPIFRHCYFRVFRRDRAKELVQETFLRAWEYQLQGKPIENIRAFLYRIANN